MHALLAFTLMTSLAAAPSGEKVIATKKVDGAVVVVSNKAGQLVSGDNKVTVAVTDAKGKPRSATVNSFSIFMPAQGAMAAMKGEAKLSPMRMPGLYQGTLEVEMKGPWKATIKFKDAKGPHAATFDVVAR